ncbi:MAG: hypothetical protein MRY83_05905, partial [Flavobacteriales bacterium]|nr:hypothetical protein [Flavobacteriales bacterium]
MAQEKAFEIILDTIKHKSAMKQQVYRNTLRVFGYLKESLKDLVRDINEKLIHDDVDDNIKVEHKTRGSFETQIKVAGDILIYHMHTNIFQFDKSHGMYNSSYIKEDEQRAYCGVINIYNFLSDSLKYNRLNDSGYLVARIFINKDMHFFVEGKRQLGFLYNDFIHSVIDEEKVREILESTILYTLDFDLLTPS